MSVSNREALDAAIAECLKAIDAHPFWRLHARQGERIQASWEPNPKRYIVVMCTTTGVTVIDDSRRHTLAGSNLRGLLDVVHCLFTPRRA